jgi:hypothetical protein
MFAQIDWSNSLFVLTLIMLPVMGGIVIAIIAIITDQRRKMQRDDMEATLKMEMIERNYKAEDIERILAARFGSRFPRGERRNRCQHGAKSEFSHSEGQQSTT